MQDLSIDIPEGQDIMVLDLLNMAKEQDPSISLEDLAEKVYAARME